MSQTTRHDRILAASRHQPTDRLPFFHYWRHSQIGWAERECRNRGMGMCWARPCYVEKMHGVEVTEQPWRLVGQTLVRRTYTTPVGSVWIGGKAGARRGAVARASGAGATCRPGRRRA